MTTSRQPLPEPLLQDEGNRYVVFPIVHKDIWEEYKTQQSLYWQSESLVFTKDRDHWKQLTDDEQYFLKHILAFFAASDGIVCENLVTRFCNEVKWTEVKLAYGFQNMMEGIHGETYSLMIDEYIRDDDEKNRLFNAVQTIPCIKKKADWAIKWIESNDASFAKRLIAFAVVEGVFFSGAFCSIYWIKQRGIFPGLTQANDYIARDEGLHTKFAILLYVNHIVNKLPQEEVHDLFKEAIDIEKEFIIDSLPCRLLGMNSELMAQYIEFVGDRLITQLGYQKLYDVSNPFDFMEGLGMANKTNFFDTKVTDYSIAANVAGEKKLTFTKEGSSDKKDGEGTDSDEDF
jgi:ribonucleotide reductase beta subunit family protein with ferritin-like domain